MFRVKICGVTGPRDAEEAALCGADAVGINFHRGSKRCVDAGRAKEIVDALRGKAIPVAVFVDADAREIRRVCEAAGIGTVQLHGEEPAVLAAALDYRRIRAIRIGARADVGGYREYPCEAFLLDAFVPGVPGGTGKTLAWNRLPVAAGGTLHGRPWILAGGLTPENVERAIVEAGPAGVDTASGVESAPGLKDRGKMRAFVENARKGFSRIEKR